MKKIFTLSLILISFTVFSQTYKAITLNETTKVLHSGALSMAGATSRVIIPVSLPNNTVEWYYSYTTSANNSSTQTLNFAMEIGAKIVGGPIGGAAKAISIPEGSGEVDIWVFTEESRYAFEYKNDYNVKYFPNLSETSSTQGTKPISSPLTGNYLIGIKNPSPTAKVAITIQVVAVIKEEATINGWTASKKQEAYNVFNQLFSNLFKDQLKQSVIDDFTGCLMSKFTVNYTPDQLSAFAEYELKNMLGEFGDKCSEELNIDFNNIAIPQQNINKDYLIGKWKDQNSTFTIYNNGTILLIFDNGKTLFGNWEIAENKLKFIFDFGKTIDEYIIIELTDKTFKYKGTKEQTVWEANKTGNY